MNRFSYLIKAFFIFVATSHSHGQNQLNCNCHIAPVSPYHLSICDLHCLIENSQTLLGQKIRNNQVRNFPDSSYDLFVLSVQSAKDSLVILDQINPDLKTLTSTYHKLLTAVNLFKNSYNPNARLSFVGTGNIQKAINDNEVPANAGFGVTYEKDFGDQSQGFDRIRIEASLNVASTVDSLIANFSPNRTLLNQSDFGQAILQPINSGQAAYFSIVAGFKPKQFDQKGNVFIPGIISGANFKITSSNRNWYVEDQITKFTSLSWQIGLYKQFFPLFNRNPDYDITFGLAYAMYHILGDVRINEELRSNILGTRQKTFAGLEIDVGIRLDNIVGTITIPLVFGPKDIAGLTGARLLTNIRFTGGFPLGLQ